MAVPFSAPDTANAILSMPLRWIFEPLAVYNLLYLFHLVAAAWCCWWLARECGLGVRKWFSGRYHRYLCSWVAAFPIGSGVAVKQWPYSHCHSADAVRDSNVARTGPESAGLVRPGHCFCKPHTGWSYGVDMGHVGLAALGLGMARSSSPGEGRPTTRGFWNGDSHSNAWGFRCRSSPWRSFGLPVGEPVQL